MVSRASLTPHALGPRRSLVPSLLLGLLLTACSKSSRFQPLEVVAWPGQTGQRLELDQPLVIEFDHRLDPALRPTAFSLRDEQGQRVVLERFEVIGRQLILYPQLPLQHDLSGGSLRPGAPHTLILRGVPRLGCISSPEGAALIGDKSLRFETLDAEEPSALAGARFVQEPLPLHHEHLANRQRAMAVVAGGVVRLRFPWGIDPRGLRFPARLLNRQGQEIAELPLHLERNLPEEAIVVAELQSALQAAGIAGPERSWSLVLPKKLVGLGQRQIHPGHQRIFLEVSS